MSSIPKDKQALIDAIEQAFEKLLADYNTIPESIAREEGVEGNSKGTDISTCDTAAYLLGWREAGVKVVPR